MIRPIAIVRLARPLAVLMALFPALVLAAAQRTEYPLTPARNSVPTTFSMKLVQHEDGHRSVEGQGSFSALDPPTNYQYVVDTRTREVTITESKPLVYSKTFEFEHLNGMSGDPSTVRDFYSKVGGGGGPLISEEFGWFWGSVRVRAKDPIAITLAQTWLRVDYYFPGAHFMQAAFKSTNFWGNPDTGITTWMVQSSSSTGPTRLSNTQFISTAHGQYLNWDWLDPNESTEAIHNISLTVSTTNILGIAWTHDDYGESSFLITGWVAINYPTPSTN